MGDDLFGQHDYANYQADYLFQTTGDHLPMWQHHPRQPEAPLPSESEGDEEDESDEGEEGEEGDSQGDWEYYGSGAPWGDVRGDGGSSDPTHERQPAVGGAGASGVAAAPSLARHQHEAATDEPVQAECFGCGVCERWLLRGDEVLQLEMQEAGVALAFAREAVRMAEARREEANVELRDAQAARAQGLADVEVKRLGKLMQTTEGLGSLQRQVSCPPHTPHTTHTTHTHTHTHAQIEDGLSHLRDKTVRRLVHAGLLQRLEVIIIIIIRIIRIICILIVSCTQGCCRGW
ncbi:hypothetical protein T492DRAFT_1148711, partial [Pavlovales sp. CCMP2436]